MEHGLRKLFICFILGLCQFVITFRSHVLKNYILLYASYSYLVAEIFSLQRISQLRLKSVVRSTPVATVAL